MDIDRQVDALQGVAAMPLPPHRAQIVRPTRQGIAGAFKDQRAGEDLIGPGQRHQAGTKVDVDSVQVVDPPALPLLDHHLTEVDADAVPKRSLVGMG